MAQNNVQKLRLGVNIDHVATVRNARGSPYPSPLQAALCAQSAGADGITAHLREDRRHISDQDIAELMDGLHLPLNLELAATDEMQAIALRHRPHAVCIVPEKREEVTTESGLDVIGQKERLRQFVAPLREAGCRISLFVNADSQQIQCAATIGAAVIELHTGAYCDHAIDGNAERLHNEFERIAASASYAASIGLEVHAGHGLTYETVKPIAALPEIVELNIGHFLISEAIYRGLADAVKEMRRLMDNARHPTN